MKTVIFYFCSLLIFLSSCSKYTLPEGVNFEEPTTKKQKRAQRKLRKAIKLDPSIITTIYTETTIHDTLRFKDTIKIPEKQLVFVTDNSLQKILDQANKKRDSAIILYEDAKNKVEYWKDKADKDNFKVTTGKGGDTVYIDKPVPYKVTVKVPGKQIPIVTYKKGLFWYIGLVVFILIILAIIIWILKRFTPLGQAGTFLGNLFNSRK